MKIGYRLPFGLGDSKKLNISLNGDLYSNNYNRSNFLVESKKFTFIRT